MNTRLLWLLALLCALGLGAWVVQATEWVEREHPLPPKGAAVDDPHYLLRQWLAHQRVTLETPERLAAMPPTQDTLVITAIDWDLRGGRKDELRQWVEAGGHLVVFGRLAQRNGVYEWLSMTRASAQQLERIRRRAEAQAAHSTPMPKEDADDEDEDDDEEDEVCHDMGDEAGAEAPYFAGRLQHRACYMGDTVLRGQGEPSWGFRDEWGWRIWRQPLGQGRVTVSGWDGLPRYRHALLDDDEPALLAATLALQPEGRIWLIGDEQRPPLPIWLWQQAGAALLMGLLALAALLARALPRFGPMQRRPSLQRRSLADQVRGTAAFLRRHRSDALRAATCRALQLAIARHLGKALPADADPQVQDWPWLAQVTGLSADKLRAAAQPGERRPTPWLQDIRLLETARRRLLALSHSPAFSEEKAPS